MSNLEHPRIFAQRMVYNIAVSDQMRPGCLLCSCRQHMLECSSWNQLEPASGEADESAAT